MKILIVDDEVTALELLDMSLRAGGYEDLDLVQSADEALSHIEHADTPYDCLLLDIVMPGMDGIALCRHVRQMYDYANVPVIMITASQDHGTLESALTAGATDYVNKPFDGLELGARLRAASLLIDATKKGRDLYTSNPSGPQTQRSSALDLTDGFTLDHKSGLMNQSDFICAFIEDEPLPRSAHLFSVAIKDAQRLFDAVPDSEFRAYVNEAATAIAHITHSWRPRITYSGDGVFLIALMDVGSMSAKGINSVFKTSLAAMSFASIPAYRGELRLCFEHVRKEGADDYRCTNALSALFRASRVVKETAAKQLSFEGEKELRFLFLGRGEASNITSCEIALPKAAPQKITPKRISRRHKIQPEAVDVNAAERSAAFVHRP